jgi:hypothetical protein
MKKKTKALLITVLLIASPLLMFSQGPPHPNGGNNPGPGNDPVGGPTGVPVDSGLCIFLVMASVYGLRKIHETGKSD